MGTFAEKLDIFFNNYCNENNFFGSLRVTHKSEILYERRVGYGNIETKEPIKKDSVFTLYSISKPFCTLGLLKLYDRGVVDIDKHPGEYVNEAKRLDNTLKIRHLLHHISGLPDFLQTPEFVKKYSPGIPERIRNHLDILQDYPMKFKPGSNTMYENINFNICALICENITGFSYSEYMQNEVFIPLGMKTAYIDNGQFCAKKVMGHVIEDRKITATEPVYDWMMGAGDVAGTVDDVYCLNKAINEKLILKNETWDMVLSTHPINGFGMGCIVEKHDGKVKITHNGGNRGFRTIHILFPEDDFDIILLSNCDWVDGRHYIANTIYDMYYNVISEKKLQPEFDKGYI